MCGTRSEPVSGCVPLSAARLLCLITLLFCAGCAGERFTRASDGAAVSFADMMQDVAQARLILVGETHDIRRHHQVQLQVLQDLNARGKRLAIGAEMFPAASKGLERWNQGRMDSLEFEWLFEDNWSGPWALYRDIFLFARGNGIPVFGLNYPKELMRKVSSGGVASLAKEEKEEIPADIFCDFDSPYNMFLRGTHRAHSRKVESFNYFCQAQTLWNKGMARRLADYLERHPEVTVVALVGTFHAVKGAIPAELPDVEYMALVPELPPGLPASFTQADFFFR